MIYEYALISVVIASGWWGYYFLRHRPHGTSLFGMMQVATAAFAGLGLIDRAYDVPPLGVFGAIGLGAGICLLILGPLVRGAARRFAAAERIGVATRLLDIAEVLAPGSGVAEEKALLGAMKEIREGRVEQTVDALTAAKDHAPADAQLAIDERIAMLYLAAYRWRDAIAYAESHLIPAIERPAPGDDEPPDTPQVSLRDVLGIAPPVWIELLGAYGRTGDLDQAARMMQRLEDACRGRDESSMWLHRGRMMFLALAGRPDSVRLLVDRKRARHMSAAARTYWVAVALQHHGDREAASEAFQRARSRSRGRPRHLIDEALAELPESAPVELSPQAGEVVAAVEAAPLPAPIEVPQLSRPVATWGLVVSLIAVAIAVSTLVGPSSDPGVLLRAGAMVRGRIADGEWWRLVSCAFVHVGPVHLIVNLIGLYFLGRVLEELFGHARTLAIYGAAGIAGALASYLQSPATMSAGASGAIFGVLGAIFIELTLHRHRYRAAWKRGLWGGLVVVTLAQAGIGFLYPVIDQWAHGAGLITGLVLGAALSPNVRWARVGLYVSRLIAVAFVGVVAVAAVMVARTSVADSFERGPLVHYTVRDVAVTAPAGWSSDGELVDPDNLVIITIVRRPTFDFASELAAWETVGDKDAKSHGFDTVDPASHDALSLPAGWQGIERIGSLEDPLGQDQHWRIVECGRMMGGDAILVTVLVPDTIARAAPKLFEGIIASITPR